MTSSVNKTHVLIAIAAVAVGAIVYLAMRDGDSRDDGTGREERTAQGNGSGGDPDDPWAGTSGAAGTSNPRLRAPSGGSDIVHEQVRVTGRVSDSDGRGIAEAEVTFTDRAGARSTMTDASGNYAAELDTGTYTITAMASDAVGGGDQVRITADLTHDIVLTPLTTVSGVVVDHRGRRISGARMEAFAYNEAGTKAARIDGLWTILPDVRLETGDDGAFSVPLPPRVIVLSASHDGVTGEVNLGKLETGTDLTGVEIVIETSAVLDGRVLDGDGSPVANATVFISLRGEEKIRREKHTLTTDEEGAFRLQGVRTGVLVIEAWLDDQPIAGPNEVRVERDARLDLVLQQEERRTAAGVFLDASGASIAGADVEVRSVGGVGKHLVVETDEEGRFEAPILPAHPYWVIARRNGEQVRFKGTIGKSLTLQLAAE